LRSYLFNQILARRISLGHWEMPLAGDVFMLRGSHSIFKDEISDDLLARYQQLDIASSASLYGTGRNQISDEAQALEEQVFAQHEDIIDCLDRQGTKLQMRALRVVVEGFSYDYDAEKRNLWLKLTLPAGSYVTTMLEHFIDLKDAS
jgi:tRNA pseudouridine13 synthase